MPVSEQDSEAQDVAAATSPRAHLPPTSSRAYLTLSPEARHYVRTLRMSLALYRLRGRTSELEAAFAAARVLVDILVEPTASGRPDLEQMRRLTTGVPEFGDLVSSAAAEAERAVCSGAVGLWRLLGLASTPPTWTADEREAARMAFACACVPAAQSDPARLQAGLRALAAHRFAGLVCRELCRSEDAWVRALGPQYDSVRHRCARRTTWRSRGLAELLRSDDAAREAITDRLERWITGGGVFPALAGELEAALVHARTPARFA